MKLSRVRGSGVDRLGDFDWSLTEAGSGRPLDLAVVTGSAGSGKTSMLEAIISAKERAAPYMGAVPWSVTPAPGARSAKIRLDVALGDEELGRHPGERVRVLEAMYGGDLPFPADNDRGLCELLGAYDDARAFGKVEYFHAGRRLPPSSPSRSGDVKVERSLRLTASDRKYAAIPAFLLGLCLDASPAREAFDRALALLAPSVRLTAAARIGDGMRPVFESESGRTLALSELSHGDEQAVLFAATFVRSGVCDSIVLVDSPELYLASERVVPFVHGLAAIGSNNQLIVATGSRDLVASAKIDAVLRLAPKIRDRKEIAS